MFVFMTVLTAGSIGIGLDALLHTRHCGRTDMGADDRCMSVGTEFSRRGRYREELFSAREMTAVNRAALRRHRSGAVHVPAGAESPPGHVPEVSIPLYTERLAEFGGGRAVSVRDHDGQIRHNRIRGAFWLGLGVMFACAGAVAARLLVGNLRAWRRRRRTTATGSDRH